MLVHCLPLWIAEITKKLLLAQTPTLESLVPLHVFLNDVQLVVHTVLAAARLPTPPCFASAQFRPLHAEGEGRLWLIESGVIVLFAIPAAPTPTSSRAAPIGSSFGVLLVGILQIEVCWLLVKKRPGLLLTVPSCLSKLGLMPRNVDAKYRKSTCGFARLLTQHEILTSSLSYVSKSPVSGYTS